MPDKPKPTPGPWFSGAMNDALFIIDKKPHVSNDDVFDIPEVRVIARVCALPEHAEDANASLIVAVHDLLDASKEVLSRLQINGDWDDGCFYYNGQSASELQMPIEKLQVAIKKAEGGQ